MVETIHLSHIPEGLALYVSCYTNVTNAAYLKEQLIAANQDFNYAFIDASVILSRKHLLAACFRALNDYIHDRLKSNNVQSEIVFCLSPNNNIGEAFRRFGIGDGSRSLVAVKVGEAGDVTPEVVERHLQSVVQGQKVEFSDQWLAGVCDVSRVRKVYKVPDENKAKDLDREAKNRLEAQVLGLMCLRGAT